MSLYGSLSPFSHLLQGNVTVTRGIGAQRVTYYVGEPGGHAPPPTKRQLMRIAIAFQGRGLHVSHVFVRRVGRDLEEPSYRRDLVRMARTLSCAAVVYRTGVRGWFLLKYAVDLTCLVLFLYLEGTDTFHTLDADRRRWNWGVKGLGLRGLRLLLDLRSLLHSGTVFACFLALWKPLSTFLGHRTLVLSTIFLSFLLNTDSGTLPTVPFVQSKHWVQGASFVRWLKVQYVLASLECLKEDALEEGLASLEDVDVDAVIRTGRLAALNAVQCPLVDQCNPMGEWDHDTFRLFFAVRWARRRWRLLSPQDQHHLHALVIGKPPHTHNASLSHLFGDLGGLAIDMTRLVSVGDVFDYAVDVEGRVARAHRWWTRIWARFTRWWVVFALTHEAGLLALLL